MNREDVLRELELLPVWQLRAPAPIVDNAPKSASILVEPQTALRVILSDDAHFLFLLEASKSSEEETLLQNMLKAIQVKPRVDIGLQRISNVSAYQAKIIIAMGEVAIQAIGLQANIDAASSQVMQTAIGAAIATFSPVHLLQNPQDKARAWQDLCLALHTVQGLQSA